jgi:predicted dehydrogenase
MNELNIGIIGLGGAGRAHVHRFRRNKSVGRIFGYDPKAADRKIAGVFLVSSPEELFDQVDAVSICTPDHLHLEGIIQALEAGKHVLVEKPMVASYREVVELEAVLMRHPRQVFAVHHQMRYAPPFQKAAELISQGKLGNIYYLEANYWHNMRERSIKFDDWRTTHGQSLIFGHACHTLDLLMYLMNSPPQSHTTYINKIGFASYSAAYTSATTILQFPGGVVAKSHVNSCCEFPQLNDLIVLGDQGSYIDGVLFKNGRFSQESDFFGRGPRHLSLNVVDIKLPRRLLTLTLSTYLKVFTWLSNRLMSHPDFGFRKFPLTVYNHDAACQIIIDNYVAAVQGIEPVLVGFHDAARVIKLCEELELEGLQRIGP